MYIGRFVVLGKTSQDAWYLGYRVSSRSFPQRQIVLHQDRATVMPTPDAPPSDNPYIAYNCYRSSGDAAGGQTLIVANGSHVDPAIDKIGLGYPLRDALALSLLALDYEHDDYNTPRITAGLDLAKDQGLLAIVADDQLTVRRLRPEPGQAYLIATYELTASTPITLEGNTADDLAQALFDADYEHPVASLAVLADAQSPVVAIKP